MHNSLSYVGDSFAI